MYWFESFLLLGTLVFWAYVFVRRGFFVSDIFFCIFPHCAVASFFLPFSDAWVWAFYFLNDHGGKVVVNEI